MTLRVHPDEIVAKARSPLLAVPPHWKRARLEQVAEVQNGYAFKSKQFSRSGGMPLLRIRDVGRDQTETNYVGDYEDRYLVVPGDLVVGMDGDFRIARWNGPPALLNQRVCRIRVREPVIYNTSFLVHVLPGYLDAIHEHTSSVTVKHLSSRTVQEIPLPLPSLAEQELIVEEIDKQLTRLDSAVASLRRARASLPKLRRSTLDSAFFRNGSPIPKGWTQVSVSDVGEVRLGRQRSPKNRADLYPRPYLRAANVDWHGLKLDDIKEMDFKPQEFEAYQLKPGDVLIGEASGSRDEVGKPAVWSGEIEGCCFQNTLIRVRPNKAVDPSYLYHHFLADAMSGRFGAAARGVGIHHLGSTTLSQWSINLAPADEQSALTADVARILSILDALEKEIEAGLRRAERLRQSILSSAFAGRLIPEQVEFAEVGA
jgi:type I restriction enzyme S subunit